MSEAEPLSAILSPENGGFAGIGSTGEFQPTFQPTKLNARALAGLPDDVRAKVLAELSLDEAAALEFEWSFWARPDQLAPEGFWRTWLLLGGRGSGKTRSSVENVRTEVEAGRRGQIGIVGPTADAVRRVQIEGPSGILATAPDWFRPSYEPSRRVVVWPNGAVAHLFSAEEPDRMRGPNLDYAWADEITSWADPQAAWDMLQMCLRVPGPKGHAPRAIVSTTPKPMPLLKAIMAADTTVITRAKTADNAGNLDPSTLAYLQRRYGGTTLGRQELDAELLEDVEGALWTRAMLDAGRRPFAPDLRRVVVGVDPAGGTGKGSTETGIIIAGKAADGHAYVVGDVSGKFSPEQWARRAVDAYRLHHADRIVAERNYGGEMVEATIRAIDPNVPVRMVSASRGKALRAEPVVALYEQGQIHHVGVMTEMEDQLCQWNPNGNDPSPDRLDALVWALTELMLGEAAPTPARWTNKFNGFMGR